MLLRIYYLDDEEALCENFFDYFSSKDVEIKTFVDPSVAIDAIKKNPPDLFFVDYRLPGTTGDEVAKVLDSTLPKILITGDISVNTDYRFDRVFPKPYDYSVVAELISSYVSAKKTA